MFENHAWCRANKYLKSIFSWKLLKLIYLTLIFQIYVHKILFCNVHLWQKYSRHFK